MSAPTAAPKSGRRSRSRNDDTDAFASPANPLIVSTVIVARAAINGLRQRPVSSVRALVDDSLEISSIEVAFSKVKCNLLKRSLFPFLGLCQPENLTLGIQQ